MTQPRFKARNLPSLSLCHFTGKVMQIALENRCQLFIKTISLGKVVYQVRRVSLILSHFYSSTSRRVREGYGAGQGVRVRRMHIYL